MADFPILTVTRAGTLEDQDFVATWDLKWANTGREILDLKNNTGGLQKTLTILYNSTATIDGQAVTSHTLTIAINTSYVIGPFDPLLYNDANGKINFTVSSPTLLSACVFRLPAPKAITTN